MVERILFAPGGATEAKQDTLLTELQQKLEAGQEVALNAATLAALESINATITGAIALDAPTLAALESINAVVSGTVALDSATLAALETVNAVVTGTVALDAPTLAVLETVDLGASTLAALENISATVTGTVALDAPTLAALESISVTGTVALDAPTLAALESITATISGSVAVTGPLTDAQLRAADVNVADSGEREYTHVVATVTAAGDTTIHTPAAGKRIRLHWVYAINDPVATTAPLIKVKLGASEKYRVWALSKRQLVTGATDAALVVNLGTTGNVAVTALLEEVT